MRCLKGNPFIKEAISPLDISGRRKEIYELTSPLDNVIAGRNMVIEVYGPAGIGKTLFLKRARVIAEKSRCLAVYIRIHGKEQLRSIVKKMLEETVEGCTALIAQKIIPLRLEKFLKEYDARVRKRLGSNKFSPEDVKKRSSLLEHAREAYSASRHFVNEAGAVYNKIRESVRALVFLLDDLDKGLVVRKSYETIARMSEDLENAHVPCLFVISSSSKQLVEEGYRRIELTGLSEHDIRELIERLLKPTKIKIGEECLKELIADSEGNPTILLTACRVLFDKLSEKEKLITKGHYLANRSAIINALGDEIFDEGYGLASPAERMILKLMATGETMHVSDIAKKMKKPLNTVTRLVLRLVESGNLVRAKRGQYRIFNRLYGKYISKQAS